MKRILFKEEDLANLPLPPAGYVTIGVSNDGELSTITDSGTVSPIGGGLKSSTLSSYDTIIKGASGSTSSLFLGSNFSGENLIQLSINSESFNSNNLVGYTGSNIGTFVNSNPGGFQAYNNILLMSNVEAYTSIGNGGDTAYVRYNDNRIIDFYFWGGVPTGLGEWFSINGATFSEGVDFTGTGDPYVDVMTFYTGINWGIDPTFISVEYDGDLSIRLKYSQPVKIEGFISGISFNENLYYNNAAANGYGAFLYSNDSGLFINHFGDHTFNDDRAIKKGIEYVNDYSADFATHSLVDKNYVDTSIQNIFVGLPTSSVGLTAGSIWNDGGTLKIVS